jgi:hypothetical protein
MPRLLLKGREILALSGEPNAHRLSLRARISYPTIDRYINRPETIQALDLTVLGTLLTEGLGLTLEEALALPLSTLFDLVEDGKAD